MKGSLAHDVLGHLRDLAPLVFREIKASSHDLLAHVLRDGATVVLGVERRVSAQHHVDDHAEGPQVAALKRSRGEKTAAVVNVGAIYVYIPFKKV